MPELPQYITQSDKPKQLQKLINMVSVIPTPGTICCCLLTALSLAMSDRPNAMLT